jgi:DNA-binding PadR family transcriptional regulator
MQEPTFMILVVLSREVTHGYGVLRAVESLSNGEVKLGAGTLYTALDRLTEQGLIEPDREEVEQGRLRRYYRITRRGRAELNAEIARRAERLDRVRGWMSGPLAGATR